MSAGSDILRLTILVKRKETMALDDFHEALLKHSRELGVPWMLRNGAWGYSQVHMKPDVQSTFASFVAELSGKSEPVPMLSYDAVVLLQFKRDDLGKLKATLRDPYVLNEVLPAEAHLFAEKGTFSGGWDTGANMLAGVEHVIMKDGQVV